jgi:hypothetical protein
MPSAFYRIVGNLMHKDHASYFSFTSKSRLEKTIVSLLGIIEGIAIDKQINAAEVKFLGLWLEENSDLRHRHPLSELIPRIETSLIDRVITQDEHDDLIWLCRKITAGEYYDHVTSDLQRLHGVVGGINADAKISDEELQGLGAWLDEHQNLRGCWPYDEICSLATTVLKDKFIDTEQHDMLVNYFAEFTILLDEHTITSPLLDHGGNVAGICAVNPEVSFAQRTFCFTGASSKHPRVKLEQIVAALGGTVTQTPSKKLDYLVIGADGNPCWAYACYGRKVEKAVQLRKEGARLLIIHEIDFHDAVRDYT